jgi:hypothetical protein
MVPHPQAWASNSLAAPGLWYKVFGFTMQSLSTRPCSAKGLLGSMGGCAKVGEMHAHKFSFWAEPNK